MVLSHAGASAGLDEGGLGVRDVVHQQVPRRGEEDRLCAPPPLGALHQADSATGARVALLPSHSRGESRSSIFRSLLYTSKFISHPNLTIVTFHHSLAMMV